MPQNSLSRLGLIPKHVRPSLNVLQDACIVLEHTEKIFANELKSNHKVVAWINRSSLKFIAINTPIKKDFADGSIWFFAVSPYIALGLISNDLACQLSIDDLGVFIVDDNNIKGVNEINSYLIAHAISYSPHIVLGKDANYLRELRRKASLSV